MTYAPAMDLNKLNGMKVPDLKKALEDRGLGTTGLKADLVERLKAALSSEGGEAAPAEQEAEPEAVEEEPTTAPEVAEEAPAPALPLQQEAPVYEQALAETAAAAEAPTENGEPEVSAAPVAEVGTKRDASEMTGASDVESPAKKAAAASNDDPNLPAPWQAHVSQRTGKTYWYNPDSKETTWIYPVQQVQSPDPETCVPCTPSKYARPPAWSGQLPTRPGALKCKHYMRFGNCKFGDDCRYDHPPGEAGVEFDAERGARQTSSSVLPNGFAQTGGLPVRPGVNDCSFFLKTGMCKYGETCRWNHPSDKQSQEPNNRYVKPEGDRMGGDRMGGDRMGGDRMGGDRMSGGGMGGGFGGGGMGGGGMGMMGMGGANEWEMHMSDQNRPYYYNTRTHESTWDLPPAMMMGMMGMMGGLGGGGGMGGGGMGGGSMGGGGRQNQVAGLVNGQHPIRPGQSDCGFYVKTGYCKFGETCKYNHPPELLGVGSGPPPSSGYKKVEIRSEKGVITQERGAFNKDRGSGMTTAEGYPLRPGQGDCPFYMKTGQCKFTTTCKYNHPHKGLSGLPDASAMSRS